MFLNILFVVLALTGGAAAAYFLPSPKNAMKLGNDQKSIDSAKEEAESIRAQANGNIEQIKKSLLEEENSMKESFIRMEEVIEKKEEVFKRREERNKGHQASVDKLKSEIKEMNSKRDEVSKGMTGQLTKASGLTKEQALENARTELSNVITENKDAHAKAHLEEFEDDLQRHAKAVLQVTIQRLGVQSSVDKNSTSINIKDDKFKGMLVGKDGNNIAYLESLLPVALIFNLGDPETLHIGGVNLLRRNIAKRAITKLQKLVKKTKRVDHKLIKESVDNSEKEIMDECDRKGQWAFKQMGIDAKSVDPEIVNYIGRLYFRTSYGQNIIHHSLEMAFAARLIAELIGTDVDVAMQGAFYHDLGKAIDHDVGGAHDDLSKEILDKHGFDPRIVHAAFAHHDKVPCEAPADFIVKAVDAISGGRPGARMESVTNYFERIKQLEDIAKSFKGVNKVFTMSAGREVRVLVNKDQIQDEGMLGLAENVAEKISDEMAFPGIIKVNLIRQSKSVDYAREKTRKH